MSNIYNSIFSIQCQSLLKINYEEIFYPDILMSDERSR